MDCKRRRTQELGHIKETVGKEVNRWMEEEEDTGAGSPLEEEAKEVDWKKEEEEGDMGAGSPLEEKVKEVDWKRRRRRRKTQELGHLSRRRR